MNAYMLHKKRIMWQRQRSREEGFHFLTEVFCCQKTHLKCLTDSMFGCILISFHQRTKRCVKNKHIEFLWPNNFIFRKPTHRATSASPLLFLLTCWKGGKRHSPHALGKKSWKLKGAKSCKLGGWLILGPCCDREPFDSVLHKMAYITVSEAWMFGLGWFPLPEISC